jgi:hypothetical protein
MVMDLEIIKQKIEKLDKLRHIEILKIIKKYPEVKLNENKSGVFINISFLPEIAIKEIFDYLQYIEEQELLLNTVETEKKILKDNLISVPS